MQLIFASITIYCSLLLCDCYRYPDPVNGERCYTYTMSVRRYLGSKYVMCVPRLPGPDLSPELHTMVHVSALACCQHGGCEVVQTVQQQALLHDGQLHTAEEACPPCSFCGVAQYLNLVATGIGYTGARLLLACSAAACCSSPQLSWSCCRPAPSVPPSCWP